ncbi:MAG: polysaccharide deacetylase family protein [Gudongella sp.]|jgi:peptidoglycan/xylan/chitin deacetylase (PgdA/CDA1 family)|nr:polysaccharide deacetylase family protein [Gudongella sp.]
MKRKIISVLFLITIIAVMAFAGPELYGHFFGGITGEAKSLDVDKAIKYAIFENPVLAAKADWIVDDNSDVIEDERAQLIREHFESVVNVYQDKYFVSNEEITFPPKVDGKFVYLTFDDGPSEKATPQILEILGKYSIKATFFVVGSMSDKYPERLREIRDAGHAIGNHTYSHVYSYLYKNTANFMADIRKTENTFKRILGDDFETKLVRFPGGSFGDYKNPFKKVLEDEGYQWFDWNTVNGDAEKVSPSESYLLGRFLNTYGKRDVVVILMHDADVKQNTVNVLPKIIEHLLNEGYTFRTLDQFNH